MGGRPNRYCQDNAITFTRSRPWRKNDQAWVEQKKGAVVRGVIGYRRFTSPAAANLLTTIHNDLHAYVNFFQPVLKLVEKQRDGAKIYKRYDTAQTPYQRAIAVDTVAAIARLALQEEGDRSPVTAAIVGIVVALLIALSLLFSAVIETFL